MTTLLALILGACRGPLLDLHAEAPPAWGHYERRAGGDRALELARGGDIIYAWVTPASLTPLEPAATDTGGV